MFFSHPPCHTHVSQAGSACSLLGQTVMPRWISTGKALTWVKVGLHNDTDGAALPQVSDTDAFEILLNIRIAEKLIQLVGWK